MKPLRLFLIFFLLIVSARLALADYTGDKVYCYQSQCFESLQQAEAAMKADSIYGGLLQLNATTPNNDLGVGGVTYSYTVPNQPPQDSWTSYDANGRGHQYCSGADPHYPGSCATEQDAAAGWYVIEMQSMAQGLPSCTPGAYRFAGSYVNPFESISVNSGTPNWADMRFNSTSGEWVGSNDAAFVAIFGDSRRVEYDYTCTNGAKNTVVASFEKDTTYVCPAGFYPYSVNYNDPNKSSYLLGLCRPSGPLPYITGKIRQVSSCPANPNPCHPATGDKSRAEADFYFAGRPFTRYYHSLKEFHVNGMAPGWTHTYTEQVGVGAWSYYYLLGGDGNFESFVWTSAPRLRLQNSADRVIDQLSSGGWHLTEADGETRDFDSQGRLLNIRDASDPSRNVDLVYNGSILVGAIDNKGRSITFAYNQAGLLASVTLPDGGLVTYGYDSDANLVSATYPDGHSKLYSYHESGLADAAFPNFLTGITSEDGQRYASFGYDASGRVISSRLVSGSSFVANTALTYMDANTVNVTTDGKGLRVYSVLAGLYRRVLGIANSAGSDASTFTSDDRLNTYTDARGAITKFTYQPGYVSSITTASGTANERQTTIQRDASNRVVQQIHNGIQGAAEVPLSVDLVSYNTLGQAIAQCFADSSVAGAASYSCGSQTNAPLGVRQVLYSYCAAIDASQCPIVGLLLSVDGPRTDVSDITHYSYYLTTDESGCGTVGGACHRAGDLYQVADALGHVSTMVAYDKNGRVVRSQDSNNVITDLTYTPRGWLKTRTVGGASTTIDYDAVGNVIKITDADGVFVGYTYDAAHRLTDISDAVGNHIHYTLDAAGNKTKEDTYDSGNTLRRTLSRSYNTLGQLIGVTDGLNHTVFNANYTDSYDANGNLVHTADGLGIQRKQGYDALNRLVSMLDNYNGTDTATQNTQATFAYDALDNLEGVTDPDGLSTTYDYDGLSNPKALHSPDTGSTGFQVDAAGNRIQQTDAKGTVRTTAYDALNRPITVSYPDSTQNIAYHYDEANSVTGCASSFPVGRLTRIVEAAVTTTYCYDNHGNVTRKVQAQGSQVDTTTYSYTAADRLSSLTTPSQTLTQYSRDAAGRISGVTVTPNSGAGQTVVSAISYLPFGPISSYTLGNGQTISRSYDANYQLTDLTSPALNLHFTRDVMGNITALGNVAGASPAVEAYSYDPLYRLTGVTDGDTSVESYTYNKTGDRLSKTKAGGLATGSYGYQSGTHWLTSVGNAARSYDLNGNTIGSASAGETLGYGYNDRNRLTLVQRNQQTVATYVYNAMGERVAKLVTSPQAVNERFAYNEASQLVGEYGTTNRDYIWLGSLPVAVVDDGTASTVNYVHADGLGTPRAISDAVGNTIWQWPYQSNPFGEQQPTGGYAYNSRFPGQYYDVESRQVANGFRSYDPATGRYIQSDLLGLNGGGLTTYGYAGANPTSNFDLLGLYCQSAGGSTYCSYPGGPSFVVPTPNGFKDFSADDNYYHAYDITRNIGGADPNCVMKQLVNNPVPNNPNGGVRPATAGGTPNIAYIPIIGTDNQVTSYLTENLSGPGMVAVNMTGNGSTFAQGYAARTVSDGVAHTYGEGTSPIQSNLGQDQWGPIPLGALNNFINERVWGGQMDEFISKAQKRCGCGS
jgi:RHS repeat-associated protein